MKTPKEGRGKHRLSEILKPRHQWHFTFGKPDKTGAFVSCKPCGIVIFLEPKTCREFAKRIKKGDYPEFKNQPAYCTPKEESLPQKQGKRA